jgi:virginiamycin B lyase
MHEQQHIPEMGEQNNEMKATRLATPVIPRPLQSAPRWSVRRRRDAWFLLVAILLGMLTTFALSGGGAWLSGQTSLKQLATSPAQTATNPLTAPSSTTATGQFHEYPFPQSDSQVMRLVVDHAGRVWFGEMGRNALAVFDPRTHTFQQMTPPHGRFGMMGMQVAPDDTIWFAEQYANYIGHYFPATGHFQVYPLPRLTIPDPSHTGKTLTLPSAPNELALDAQGNVWFTEFNAATLGRLDPRTGLIRHYPLAARRSIQTLLPYGVAVDPQGMIWFTELSTDQVGRLDPVTGRIRFFPVPGSKVSLMEIASDAHGTIWVTSFENELLLRLDPRTATFTRYDASPTGNGTGGLYGLVVTPAGNVWVTMWADNMLAHLDVTARRFVYYRIPTPGSKPLSMALGPDQQTLWFNEVDKLGMVQLETVNSLGTAPLMAHKHRIVAE